MGFTKFKLLGERLLSGLGKNKTFFPIYDNQADADFRVSLNTLITFISNELGVSSKAVFELTGVSNTGNNYISTLDISSYKTEGLYIFKPSTDSDDVTTLNVNSVGTLDIKEFDGTSLVDKTDLKAVNTYLLLNKTTYWLVVGGVSGEHPNPTSYLAHATVDGVYGDDSYAELNNPKRPYLTITAAQDALKLAIITTISSPVQCKGFCYVKQGVYFDEYLINRQYVDMHFEYGAIVISDTDGKPVISDTDGNNEPVNINITGQGQFYHTRYNPQGLDNQAVALSNSDSKEFNFEAYEVDGIQIYGGNSITTKINVKNTRIRFTIFVGNKKSIHFEKCKFLSGLDLDSFFHDDNEITCNECEFIVPSDNLDSLVEIRDLSNTLIDTIDVSSGVQSGEPFQFGSGTRLELQNSHVGAHYHPIIAGIYLSNTYLDVHGNPSINSRYSVTNSKIRIQKDGGIGIFLSQTCEVNLSQPEHPNWIFRDIQIEDETQNKTTTALVAKKRDTLSTTIPYMFASIISNCEVTIGSGYEAGYVAIDTSYEFVPEGSTGLETFAQGLTIVSNAINLDCQNKAFPVFNVGSFGTSPLDITISNSYGVVEATLIIECSSFPSGLITLPIVSYPPTYQPSSGINRIVLKMNWLSGNYIWTITEQSTTDKQNIQLIKSSNFSAENDNNYTTIGTSTVTEPTGINGKGYSVIVISGTTTIDSIPYSTAGTKITRLYNGSIWLTKVEIASGGATNLGYTPSATNGIITSDTGTDATLTLVDGTNAGLVSPSMKSTWDGKLDVFLQSSIAYVDTNGNDATGLIGRLDKKFLTIDAALIALPVSGGIVEIGVGTFQSPTGTNLKDNIWLKGSGQPDFNWTVTPSGYGQTRTAPTKLIGGTILQNTLTNLGVQNKNIWISDLGVDVGSDWCTASNVGVAKNGIVFSRGNSVPAITTPVTNVHLENVTSLGKTASSLFHAILFDNGYDVVGRNIKTCFNVHGLALKASVANIDGIQCYGHEYDGIIVKSNAYAYSRATNITNVYIGSVSAFDGGGFNIQNGETGVDAVFFGLNLSNFYIENVTRGITLQNAGIDNVNISNGIIVAPQSHGIYAPTTSPFNNSKISNVIVRNSLGIGVLINSALNTTISNLSVISSVGNGINLSGNGKLICDNIIELGSSATGVVYGANVYAYNVNASSVSGTPAQINIEGSVGSSAGNTAIDLAGSSPYFNFRKPISVSPYYTSTYRATNGGSNLPVNGLFWSGVNDADLNYYGALINTQGALNFIRSNATNKIAIAGLRAESEDYTANVEAGAMVFDTKPAGSASTEKMRITSIGRVGIGTATPAAPLHVYGSGSTLLERTTANTTGFTTSFVIRGTSTGDMTATFGTGILFQAQDNAAVSNNIGAIAARIEASDNTSSMDFYTYNAGVLNNRLSINSAGNVGIGVTVPTSVLHLTASTTSYASLRIAGGVAPSSPNTFDVWSETTNNRLMFRQNATNVQIIGASAVTTEVVVSDTTLTININGTTYKLLARA